ncbi:MAG: hypothetical protein QF619_12150 [Candidatus Binatia bacterium]|nr:hypothetical protein [Candidatus Binatia bacterium]
MNSIAGPVASNLNYNPWMVFPEFYGELFSQGDNRLGPADKNLPLFSLWLSGQRAGQGKGTTNMV